MSVVHHPRFVLLGSISTHVCHVLFITLFDSALFIGICAPSVSYVSCDSASSLIFGHARVIPPRHTQPLFYSYVRFPCTNLRSTGFWSHFFPGYASHELETDNNNLSRGLRERGAVTGLETCNVSGFGCLPLLDLFFSSPPPSVCGKRVGRRDIFLLPRLFFLGFLISYYGHGLESDTFFRQRGKSRDGQLI